MITIKVSDFTKYPGPRYKSIGPNSGEDFRDSVLIPAIQEHGEVSVDLDGTLGFGSSFLEEAFGGLKRKHMPDDKINFLINHIKSEEEPYLIDEIKQYITDQE